MAAYSRLASRSQAKFQTMKLSPLSAQCAAAPAKSTVSTCRSLRFLPRSYTDVNLTLTVPVAFPRHFRGKKRSQLVAAYLACQSVAGVGIFPRHIWHKMSFILTCVKSRSLPVNKARWQNHVTDLRWVRYSWSHGSASREGSSSQCDGPSRMTTRQGSAAQVPDSAKDDGSSQRVTSQLGGTTRQRMTSQRSWTNDDDDPAGVADPEHDDDDPAGVADPAHDDDDRGGAVDSPHHQDLVMDSPVEIHAPEEVLQLPAKRSSDGSSKSKRAMTATSSGSKATEVEQSAVWPSRSRQPKKSVAPTGQNATDHKVGIAGRVWRARCPGYPSREHSSCKIGFIHVISLLCHQWPKPATRIAEAATSSKTSKATDARLSRFHVKKSSKIYSARSPLFTQSWAWSQRSPSWIWETSRPRARHSAARLGEESETATSSMSKATEGDSAGPVTEVAQFHPAGWKN